MKKTLPLALLAFVVFIAASWSVVWFIQSYQAKKQVEEMLLSLDPAYGVIKAEEISVSGFPAEMVITLVNPSATLNLQQLGTKLHKILMLSSGNSAAVLTTPEFSAAKADYHLDGKISFKINALSNRFEIRHSGISKNKIYSDSTGENINISTEYNGETSCLIAIDNDLRILTSNIWNLAEIASANNPFLRADNIRNISCNSPGFIATNLASGQILATMENFEFKIDNDSLPERTKARMYFKVKEFEMMPEGDVTYAAMMQMLFKDNQDDSFAYNKISIYGKQSMSFSGALDVPEKPQQNVKHPFKFEINDFSSSNIAGNTKSSLLFSIQPQGDIINGELSLDILSEYNNKQTEIAKQITSYFAAEIVREFAASGQFSATDNSLNQKELEEVLFNALPDVSTLSPMTEKIKMNFSFDSSKTSGNMAITALELSSRDYGITATGKGEIAADSFMPAVNAEIICRNCLNMFKVITSYLPRADHLLSTIYPNEAGKIIIDQQTAELTNRMLSAVGKKAENSPSDLIFTIKSDTEGVSVNDKSLPELMLLMQEYKSQIEP